MVCSRSGLALGAAVAVHLTACGARSELLGLEAGELTLDCPTTLDDPRLVMLTPGDEFPLDAAQFVAGWPDSYKWSVLHDDCDGTATNRSYTLEDPTSAVATFIPARPSSYRVRLEVATGSTDAKSCEFALPVQGRGLRVELCWSNDEEADIDLYLYLHSPFNQNPFLTWQAHFNDYGHESSILSSTADTCNVLNCTPVLREVPSRVDFGYAASSAAECQGGPGAQVFADLGICPTRASASTTIPMAHPPSKSAVPQSGSNWTTLGTVTPFASWCVTSTTVQPGLDCLFIVGARVQRSRPPQSQSISLDTLIQDTLQRV